MSDNKPSFMQTLRDVTVATASTAAIAGTPVAVAYAISDENVVRVIKNEFAATRSDLGEDNVKTMIDAYVETRRQTTAAELAKHYNKEPNALTEQDAVNFAIDRTLEKIHASELALSAQVNDNAVKNLLTDFSVQFLVRKAEKDKRLAQMRP